jgi:PilZ domain
MSARNLGNVGSLQQQVTVEGRQARLELSAEAVAIHKNGIEFRSPTPFHEWAEMTIALQSPDGSKLHCAGVVIACSGNKHTGYHISMVFTSLSKQAQATLNVMADSSMGL